MAGKPSSSRWDLSNWTTGPVTFFDALGIKKGTIQYPQLQAKLTQASIGSDTAQSSSNTASNPADNAPGPTGTCNAAQTSSNKKLAQQLLPTQWKNQWNDVNSIVMAESGWCNTIQNPNSTAYGIGQFLNTTWASTGYTKTSDPKAQILAMYVYIKMSYGSPSAAWAFHQANGWY